MNNWPITFLDFNHSQTTYSIQYNTLILSAVGKMAAEKAFRALAVRQSNSLNGS